MPPKSLPSRKKNGQFTTHVGQPPSSLATPPIPQPPSRIPSSRNTSPSRLDPPPRAPSPQRTGLSALIDPASDSDCAPTFAAPGRSRSASPTISAPAHSRSSSPATSDLPTSLESGQLHHSQNWPSNYIIPLNFHTSLPYSPALISRPRSQPLYKLPTPPPPPLPPRPVFQHTIKQPSSVPPLATTMTNVALTGPAAMPSARSSRAPHFSGASDELITEFLHEYEELANGFRLTMDQKLETILRYVPRTLRHLWMMLPSYQNGDWDDFRAHLEEIHPDVAESSRNTTQGLETFKELSAKHRIRDEADLLKYYRNFLTVATPLLVSGDITIHEYNTAFFRGFHPSIQDTLADRFDRVYPHHPVDHPFPVEGIMEVARRHFKSNHFHRSAKFQKGKARDKHHSHSKRHYDTPDAFIQRTYGVSHSRRRRRSRSPEPDSASSLNSDSDSDSVSESDTDSSIPVHKTKSVHFKHSHSSRSRGKEDDDPLALVTKLQSLSVHKPTYLVLYTRCQKHFPEIAQNLPKPQLQPAVPASVSVSYQSNAVATQPLQPQQYLQPQVSVPPHPSVAPAPALTTTNPKTDFFSGKYGVRPQNCSFCGLLGHRLRACPAAEEYVDTGRVKIINHRLYLPTGEPIPNDGRGLGLKAGVDAWLTANLQYCNTSTTPTMQCDPPPHATSFSVEVLPDLAAPTGAYITEADADSDTSGGDNYPRELFDMFEVFTNKKTESAPTKPATPLASASAPAPMVHNSRPPQYRYQASAEDQFLTKQVMDWILEGKLEHITPAHIFATSPPIRKELVEHLRPRRVETNSFEQVSTESADLVAVLELAAKREAEFSLPLREIDVLVNNLRTEAGVLDQGSQIVVMREDLAKEVGARINTQRTLHMEGANGSTSHTLGCAEDLNMRIGDVSFTIHAHVVRTAPFRLLLGRPFHHLLLCRLEDHPDRVDVSICDPDNPTRCIAVPSRARRGAQVGFVSTLTCQVHSEPPHIEAPECYVATPTTLPFTELTLPDQQSTQSVELTKTFQATEGPSTDRALAHNDEPPGIPESLSHDNQPNEHTSEVIDRATTRKSTGHPPFYMAHGIEPVLPFDITLATFLVPNLTNKVSTADLIATRTRQLLRREDDLATIHSNVLKSRFESVRQFERQFENTIRDYDFGPGAFVLVRNSSVESDLGRKAKPRYTGPMVVLRRTQNGSYCLAELDGTVSNLRFAAFRVVPYHARSRSSIPVTRLVEREDLASVNNNEDVTRADPDDISTADGPNF